MERGLYKKYGSSKLWCLLEIWLFKTMVFATNMVIKTMVFDFLKIWLFKTMVMLTIWFLKLWCLLEICFQYTVVFKT